MNPSSMREVSQAMFDRQFGEAAQMPQPSQALVDRFEQLMEHAEPCTHVDSSVRESIVGKAIAQQEAQWQTVPNDVLYMMQQQAPSPQASPTEVMTQYANEAVYVVLEMAQMNADLNVKLAVVKSAKGSVETLMKNQ